MSCDSHMTMHLEDDVPELMVGGVESLIDHHVIKHPRSGRWEGGGGTNAQQSAWLSCIITPII